MAELMRACRDLPGVEHVHARWGEGSLKAVLFMRAASPSLAEQRASAAVAGVLPRSGRMQATLSWVSLDPPAVT